MPITIANPFAQNEAVTAHAAIDEIATKAANVQELFASGYYSNPISVSLSFPIFTAPFALQAKQVSVVFYATVDMPADDVNYWRIAVRRTRNNLSTGVGEIAAKSTQLTGGEAITSKVDWNYDTVTFSPTFSVLLKGDTVDLSCVKTGTPPNLVGTLCTVRYEPL
jgi:hypothetical protein